MSNYDHVAAIYDFAKDHGYKVQNFNTQERRNQRGRYNYVTVAFVVPIEEPRKLEKIIAETEEGLQDDNSAEAQKEEVINHEI